MKDSRAKFLQERLKLQYEMFPETKIEDELREKLGKEWRAKNHKKINKSMILVI